MSKMLVLSLLAAAFSACATLAADSTPPAEVLLSRQLAEARGIEVGEVVRLGASPTGDDARPFRVVGTYEPIADPFRLTARRWEARLHLPELLDLVADPLDPAASESVTRLNVVLRDPEDAQAFAADVAARLPGLVASPTHLAGDGSDPFVVLERFHVAIAAVTILGSAAFLLALMVMRSEERRENAGILRLIGLSRPRILLEIFFEGLLVALAGTAFGLLLALALEDLFNRFFQWHYDTALLFVRVDGGIALRCVLVAVPLGVLAGLAASWTLLRRNIMALLRR